MKAKVKNMKKSSREIKVLSKLDIIEFTIIGLMYKTLDQSIKNELKQCLKVLNEINTIYSE